MTQVMIPKDSFDHTVIGQSEFDNGTGSCRLAQDIGIFGWSDDVRARNLDIIEVEGRYGIGRLVKVEIVHDGK